MCDSSPYLKDSWTRKIIVTVKCQKHNVVENHAEYQGWVLGLNDFKKVNQVLWPVPKSQFHSYSKTEKMINIY